MAEIITLKNGEDICVGFKDEALEILEIIEEHLGRQFRNLVNEYIIRENVMDNVANNTDLIDSNLRAMEDRNEIITDTADDLLDCLRKNDDLNSAYEELYDYAEKIKNESENIQGNIDDANRYNDEVIDQIFKM